jgi:putative PepSY-like beta-lactamase-inhibitor
MKVKALITGLIAVIGLFSFTVATNKTEVPRVVKEAFAKKYPDAQKVKWEEEEEGEYEAEFKLMGKEMSANFKADGTWLETEVEIKTKDLPQTVKDAIATQFSGYKIEEAEQLETPDSPLSYEVSLENEKDDVELTAVFSVDGILLKKKVEDEDDEGDDDGGNK